ncbi:hypothetical protein [[Phormidium] sp. ETS-05]|uniref:hypothetical protein n=1 Tax=[Phormidium] sp. ETS-05 TaxID=222819 RepID=UPI0018EF1C80|nr:hypothetical protein [[Phormidium] sp. ETS-05]
MESLALVCLTAVFVSIWAVVVQMILLMKGTKQTVGAAIIVGSGIILPPIILFLLSGYPPNPLPWLFTVFSWAVIDDADLFSILAAIVCQLSILAGLSVLLKRQLLMVGESASKALLEAK